MQRYAIVVKHSSLIVLCLLFTSSMALLRGTTSTYVPCLENIIIRPSDFGPLGAGFQCIIFAVILSVSMIFFCYLPCKFQVSASTTPTGYRSGVFACFFFSLRQTMTPTQSLHAFASSNSYKWYTNSPRCFLVYCTAPSSLHYAKSSNICTYIYGNLSYLLTRYCCLCI